MKKIKLLATAFTAALLSLNSSYANESNAGEMEKCKVINKEGKNIIKE